VISHPIKYNLKLEATYAVPNVENTSENRGLKSSQYWEGTRSKRNGFLERVLFVGTKLGTASFKNKGKIKWTNSLF